MDVFCKSVRSGNTTPTAHMSDVVYASSIDEQARIKAVQQIAHRQITLTALQAYTIELEARLVGGALCASTSNSACIGCGESPWSEVFVVHGSVAGVTTTLVRREPSWHNQAR